MLAVQCSQSGWDRYAGNEFVVEFEISPEARLFTGGHRNRLWRLLSELERRAFWEQNNMVIATLSQPDPRYVAAFPPAVQDWYRKKFTPSATVPDATTGVWFRYYDEQDAAAWAGLLARSITPAIETFLAQPPSFFGHRPSVARTRSATSEESDPASTGEG